MLKSMNEPSQFVVGRVHRRPLTNRMTSEYGSGANSNWHAGADLKG